MLNKVVLMGRLTKDPEIRYTSENNIPVARFTLAVDRRAGKQGAEKQTDFINCTAWNKTAEFINNYFVKGKAMVLVGRIQTRSWDNQEGKKQYATDVVADEVYFADSKSGETSKPQAGAGENAGEGFFPVDSDDELPF